MKHEILAEMVDIALMRREPKKTIHFAKVELHPLQIYWGCIRILEWLRIQSVALQVRPLRLNPLNEFDKACMQLIEASEAVRQIVKLSKNNVLMFAESVSLDEAKAMMIYAKEHYRPRTFVHSPRGRRRG